jgi:hypothetical protein
VYVIVAYKRKQRQKQKSNTPEIDYQRYLAFRGLYSRVAKQQNVSRQFVQQVAQGVRTSKRISTALARELQRIERRIAPRPEAA